MIEFHDYDPAHPFPVTSEKHIIQDGRIILDYVPLKASVTIEGFRECTTGSPGPGEFYIRYGDEDGYRTADQIVHFSEGYDGLLVTVDYLGVSTILRARHMNEIKKFMEFGASELAARMIIAHEEAVMDTWKELLALHCGHICDALEGIRKAIASGGGIDPDSIAEDYEADEVLDELFPGDVPVTPKVSEIADDDEVREVLDEIFPESSGA